MKSKLALVLSTFFGCGYSPFAPGTAGSIGAALAAWAMIAGAGFGRMHLVLLTLAALAPAIWAAGVTAKEAGRKDPGLVVIDEVLGQWITLGGATVFNWKSFLGAFLLFRALDIWKPSPVRQLEALPGGYGIVADDLMAGVYGAVVLYAAGCFNLY